MDAIYAFDDRTDSDGFSEMTLSNVSRFDETTAGTFVIEVVAVAANVTIALYTNLILELNSLGTWEEHKALVLAKKKFEVARLFLRVFNKKRGNIFAYLSFAGDEQKRIHTTIVTNLPKVMIGKIGFQNIDGIGWN